jgi:hypothetical protein
VYPKVDWKTSLTGQHKAYPRKKPRTWGTFQARSAYLLLKAVPTIGRILAAHKAKKECIMGGELIGLVAVILGMGVPLGALYTYFRVRKLRSEERLAAIARGVDIPMEPELNQVARSRRAGILLVSGALGYIFTFGLIAQIQADRDVWTAAALGIIPLAVGIGYFVDWSMIRRDARA